jgi:hypothetical protein
MTRLVCMLACALAAAGCIAAPEPLFTGELADDASDAPTVDATAPSVIDSPSGDDPRGEDGASTDAPPGDVLTDAARVDGTSDGAPRDAASDDASTDAAFDAGAPVEAASDASTDATGPDGAIDGAASVDAGPVVTHPGPCGAPFVVPGGSGTTTMTSLGPQAWVDFLWQDADRVLAFDEAGQSYLWDTTTGAQMGTPIPSPAPPNGLGVVVGMAGGILALQAGPQLQLLSTKDLSLLGTVPTPPIPPAPSPTLPASPRPFGLAYDGSYLWTATSSTLAAWSTSGAILATRAGNYTTATIFAAPGQLQIAGGPAGANVVEIVPLSGGSPTISAPFSGTFAAWFVDGTHFLTTVTNSTLFVYTAAGESVQIVTSSYIGEVGGGGYYFWDNDGAHELADGATTVVPGSHLLRIWGWSDHSITIADLAQKPLAPVTVAIPFGSPVSFAYDPQGDWVVGSPEGDVYFHGTTSDATRAGALGCGTVTAITGSPSGAIALTTTSGGSMVIDVATAETLLRLPSSQMVLSDDGTTFAALSSGVLDVLTPPSWATEYSYGTPATLSAFTLSRNEVVLVRVSNGSQRLMTDLAGATTIYSDASGNIPLLSPSGMSWVDVLPDQCSDCFPQRETTRFYVGGTLMNAVADGAIGWLDDSRVVAQSQSVPPNGSIVTKTTVYDPLGHVLASPPLPPMSGFTVVGPNAILSASDNNVYDATSGGLVATTGIPPTSGGYVPGYIPLPAVVAGGYLVWLGNGTLEATRFVAPGNADAGAD